MWLLTGSESKLAYKVQLGANPIIIGRHVNATINLAGSQAVSRKAASVSVRRVDDRHVLYLVDLSSLAGGVTINDCNGPGKGVEIALNDGDIIQCSRHPNKIKVSWIEIVICLSRIDAKLSASTGAIGIAAERVAASLSRELAPQCTHLIVKDEPAVITTKLACALIMGIEILTERWLLALADPQSALIPEKDTYRPKTAAGAPVCSLQRFKESCADLFAEILFIFFSTVQVQSYKAVIECAGGTVALLRWRDAQHAAADPGAVLQELNSMTTVKRVLIAPRADKLEVTGAILALLTSNSITCSDESLITTCVLERDITVLQMIPTAASVASAPMTAGLGRGESAMLVDEHHHQDGRNVLKRLASEALPFQAAPLKKAKLPPLPAAMEIDEENDEIIAANVADIKPQNVLPRPMTNKRIGSTAGNAIIIGFDLPKRNLPAPRSDGSNLPNFKSFRKANIEQGYEASITSVSTQRPVVVTVSSSGPSEVGMSAAKVAEMRLEDAENDEEDVCMDEMFMRANAPTGNVSRRRKQAVR